MMKVVLLGGQEKIKKMVANRMPDEWMVFYKLSIEKAIALLGNTFITCDCEKIQQSNLTIEDMADEIINYVLCRAA